MIDDRDLEEDWDDSGLDDDYLDDPNLYLPNHFVTCFRPDELTMYRQAVDELASKHPQHDLDIDTSGSWNPAKDPALLYYGRGGEVNQLALLWPIVDRLREASSR